MPIDAVGGLSKRTEAAIVRQMESAGLAGQDAFAGHAFQEVLRQRTFDHDEERLDEHAQVVLVAFLDPAPDARPAAHDDGEGVEEHEAEDAVLAGVSKQRQDEGRRPRGLVWMASASHHVRRPRWSTLAL